MNLPGTISKSGMFGLFGRLDDVGTGDADEVWDGQPQVDSPFAGADQQVGQFSGGTVDEHLEWAIEERQRRNTSHLQAGQRFRLFVRSHAHFLLAYCPGYPLQVQLPIAGDHNQHRFSLGTQHHQSFVNLLGWQSDDFSHASGRVDLGGKGENLVWDFARIQGAHGVCLVVTHASATSINALLVTHDYKLFGLLHKPVFSVEPHPALFAPFETPLDLEFALDNGVIIL